MLDGAEADEADLDLATPWALREAQGSADYEVDGVAPDGQALFMQGPSSHSSGIAGCPSASEILVAASRALLAVNHSSHRPRQRQATN